MFVLRRKTISLKQPSAVFVGTMTYGANIRAIDKIIETSSLMGDKPAKFLVVGGPLHRRFSSTKKVKFTGHLNDQSLLKVYGKSNIGLLPFFGIPNQQGPKIKLLDYMAAKLLVISSPEGVEGYTGLIPWKHYVPARTTKEMARILSNIPSNTKQFVDIATNGHRFVISHYQWTTLLQRYMAFMQNLREKDDTTIVNQFY